MPPPLARIPEAISSVYLLLPWSYHLASSVTPPAGLSPARCHSSVPAMGEKNEGVREYRIRGEDGWSEGKEMALPGPSFVADVDAPPLFVAPATSSSSWTR